MSSTGLPYIKNFCNHFIARKPTTCFLHVHDLVDILYKYKEKCSFMGNNFSKCVLPSLLRTFYFLDFCFELHTFFNSSLTIAGYFNSLPISYLWFSTFHKILKIAFTESANNLLLFFLLFSLDRFWGFGQVTFHGIDGVFGS